MATPHLTPLLAAICSPMQSFTSTTPIAIRAFSGNPRSNLKATFENMFPRQYDDCCGI